MGAEFNFDKFAAANDAEAIALGEKMIEKAAWDYGHAGYTGSYAECNGVLVDLGVEPFAKEDDAREWLLDNAEKWGPMLLVKMKDGSYCAGAWCSS